MISTIGMLAYVGGCSGRIVLSPNDSEVLVYGSYTYASIGGSSTYIEPWTAVYNRVDLVDSDFFIFRDGWPPIWDLSKVEPIRWQ